MSDEDSLSSSDDDEPIVSRRLLLSMKIKKAQQMNIANVLGQTSLSDVTFVIRSAERQKEFKVNRVFLASISEVFKAMLFGSMQESKPGCVIRIDDVDPDAFHAVLKFAHCQEPGISVQNVTRIQHLCRMYQISTLSAICDTYFENSLRAKHVCRLLTDAIDYKLDEYVAKCNAALPLLSGSAIVASDGFFALRLDIMKLLLQSDHLCVEEEEIWRAVLKWAHFEQKSCDDAPPLKRRKLNKECAPNCNLLQQVCPLIRFGLMRGDFFVNSVIPTECLTKDEIIAVSSYLLDKSTNKQRQCGAFSLKSRDGAMSSLNLSNADQQF